jgi:hypothetical protein
MNLLYLFPFVLFSLLRADINFKFKRVDFLNLLLIIGVIWNSTFKLNAFPRSNLFVFKNSSFFNKPLLASHNLIFGDLSNHVTSGYVTNLPSRDAKVLLPTETIIVAHTRCMQKIVIVSVVTSVTNLLHGSCSRGKCNNVKYVGIYFILNEVTLIKYVFYGSL